MVRLGWALATSASPASGLFGLQLGGALDGALEQQSAGRQRCRHQQRDGCGRFLTFPIRLFVKREALERCGCGHCSQVVGAAAFATPCASQAAARRLPSPATWLLLALR